MPEYNIKEEREMQEFFRGFLYFFSFLRACKFAALSDAEKQKRIVESTQKQESFFVRFYQ